MGQITQRVLDAARSVEKGEGVAAEALVAVALVETDGRSLAAVGDRFEPLIRFEGHYFDRLLSGRPREIARLAGLAHPKAGRVRNPAAQEARWRLLDRAIAIQREAAFASVSWGLGQVMGAHWQALGFASAEAMATCARASIAGQLQLVARFLKLGRLDALLARGDTTSFARRYNGPNFRRNRYDTKIAAAWSEAKAALAHPFAADVSPKGVP
ncbi:N-acetylmuramidase domain-containing protein [Aureimonas jatrophae]|uniref:N-acetylmuramidase domain-containing protein n=1 Tax=Aureimonas jatrophae TaxID=1166073 RepID=A0A1H0J5Q2_9HYPH|nr:N-acetylmuramidase domain-containing protein [Aureimonas jatrophae]MBB3951583.1 hypothetical protein [Aureimonas jatrophae]SDO39014.1 Protein of unknown function [Aureimonas jatrophae]